MLRTFIALGSLLGFLAVGLGAFATHALKNKLSPEYLTIFETGVRYQMYHALALLAVAWVYTHFSHKLVFLSAWLFLSGSIIFSGSLYILALSGVKTWGAITPIGGVLLMLGWIFLAIGVLLSP